MNSIEIKPTRSALETVDIDKALQEGRRLRAQAFTSMIKGWFGKTSQPAERQERKQGLAPDCAAPA